MSTLLTGHPEPCLSPIDHLWDIRDWRVHDLYPFPSATLPDFERQLVEQWQVIPQGIQMYNQASSKHANMLTKSINKGCVIQYINV